MEEEKELWPGAGLYLDFRKYEDEDFDKVEQRLKELNKTSRQIDFLELLWGHYIYALGEIKEELSELSKNRYASDGTHLTAEQTKRRTDLAAQGFTERGNRFEAKLKRRLNLLKSTYKIEKRGWRY